jgi:hypothetical protein
MKSIQTAAGFRVGHCSLQVVFAQKPLEGAKRFYRPLSAVIGPPRGNASGNCCRGLDWLLIERFWLLAAPAEALGPNRPK